MASRGFWRGRRRISGGLWPIVFMFFFIQISQIEWAVEFLGGVRIKHLTTKIPKRQTLGQPH